MKKFKIINHDNGMLVIGSLKNILVHGVVGTVYLDNIGKNLLQKTNFAIWKKHKIVGHFLHPSDPAQKRTMHYTKNISSILLKKQEVMLVQSVFPIQFRIFFN